MASMVNNLGNVKDSRWLQLEVCREFQRNKCSRPDTECKFAHPTANVEVQNGRVVACYDSIKSRCTRAKPPCKYFHPPQHLKDQLLINGRNHLALKNALLQQMPLQTVLAGQLPVVGPAASLFTAYARPASLVHHFANHQRAAAAAMATASFLNGNAIASNTSTTKATSSPYVTNLPAIATASSAYGAYPPTLIPGLMSAADHLTTNFGVFPTPAALIASQKTTRTDRLEVCRELQRGNCKRAESECRFAHPPDHVQVDAADGVVTVCMDYVKGRCSREQCRYFHPPPHLQAQLKAAHTRANVTPLPTASHVLAEAAAASLGKKRARDPAEDFVMTIPGLVPFTKRPAYEKSGIPVYQPGASYHQALAMHHSFVPLSLAGHHPSVPRF